MPTRLFFTSTWPAAGDGVGSVCVYSSTETSPFLEMETPVCDVGVEVLDMVRGSWAVSALRRVSDLVVLAVRVVVVLRSRARDMQWRCVSVFVEAVARRSLVEEEELINHRCIADQ